MIKVTKTGSEWMIFDERVSGIVFRGNFLDASKVIINTYGVSKAELNLGVDEMTKRGHDGILFGGRGTMIYTYDSLDDMPENGVAS